MLFFDPDDLTDRPDPPDLPVPGPEPPDPVLSGEESLKEAMKDMDIGAMWEYAAKQLNLNNIERAEIAHEIIGGLEGDLKRENVMAGIIKKAAGRGERIISPENPEHADQGRLTDKEDEEEASRAEQQRLAAASRAAAQWEADREKREGKAWATARAVEVAGNAAFLASQHLLREARVPVGYTEADGPRPFKGWLEKWTGGQYSARWFEIKGYPAKLHCYKIGWRWKGDYSTPTDEEKRTGEKIDDKWPLMLNGEKDRGLGNVMFESVLPLGEGGHSFTLTWTTKGEPEMVQLRCMTSEGRRNASEGDFKTRDKWIAALRAGGARHEMQRVKEPTGVDESGKGKADVQMDSTTLGIGSAPDPGAAGAEGGGRRKRTRRKRTGRKRSGRKRSGRKRTGRKRTGRKRKSTRRKSALRKSGLKRR